MNLYNESKGGIHFLGLFIQQNYYAPIVWNEVIQLIKPDLIIEIGTGNGNWTKLLRLMSFEFMTEIHTYDIRNNVNNSSNVNFHNEDAFESIHEIKQLIDEAGITIVLCDGGDKIKEFNLFSKLLKKNDIIAAHDYLVDNQYWNWSEIKLDDIDQNDLESFMQNDFDRAAWLVFRKCN